jgi:formylglycine-generating enzyme required for sulfatase activity
MRTVLGTGLLLLAGFVGFNFRASSAGDPPVVNDGYGDYVLVPAGPFRMGDNLNEGMPRERPVHLVDLDAFYIGKYEVTNAEFKKFRDHPGYDNPQFWPGGAVISKEQFSYWNAKNGGGTAGNENHPAIGVTWDEATAYGNWLSAKTGKKYRLPTEAEWEKAARGAGQRRYPWGNQIDPSYASYSQKPLTIAGFYDGTKRGDLQTHSNASPYGAYDMAGSLFEWCSDWYSRNYYSFSPRKNPQGPLSGAYRVLRGAACYVEPWELRAANRSSGGPSNQRHNLIGFRCARDR